MTDPRDAQRRDFLARHTSGPFGLVALPSDASPRRYFRLEGHAPRALLMDVTPGAPDFPPFLAIAAHLRTLGLSAPQVYATDLTQGFALIEDFGANTFTQLLRHGYDEDALYDLAVDTLVALHTHPDALTLPLPPYDMGPLTAELEMFTLWYVPQILPPAKATAFARAFLDLWASALATVSTQQDAVVLRDYHVDNLMVLPDRPGVAACGLLDFQDALRGSAAYDLVSLNQDARRDVGQDREQRLVQRYLSARPHLDAASFLRDYHLLGAHRATKIVGNFERLSRRDGKHGYLKFQPRVVKLLEQALDAAGLVEIRDLMDEHLPGWRFHAPIAPH